MKTIEPSAPSREIGLRARKARSLESTRVQALARIGAAGGVLTAREIKEVCQAVTGAGEAAKQ